MLNTTSTILPKLKTTFAGDLTKRESKKSKCILPISVGQQYHEDDKLFATLYEVNQAFGECVIVVCDTLYKHTKKIGSEQIDNQQIHDECVKEGKSWVDRNLTFLKQLTIPLKIIHWDEWLLEKKFNEKQEIIENLYNKDQGFKTALNKTATSFLNHYIDKHFKIEFDLSNLELCKAYLKEECAVMLLWAEGDYHFLIYSTKCTDVLSYLYKNIIVESNPGKLEYLITKFRGRALQENHVKEHKPMVNDINDKPEFISSITSNPFNFYHNKNESLTACWYGVTKAILDSSTINIEQKTTLITSLTKSFYEYPLIKESSIIKDPDSQTTQSHSLQ